MFFLNDNFNERREIDKKDSPSEKAGVFFQSGLAVEDAESYVIDQLLQCEKIVKSSMSEMKQLQQKYDMVLDGLDSNVRTRANELLLQFNQLFSTHKYSSMTTISLDRYTDESIIVRFRNREDVRVTLNFTEPDFADEQHTIQNVEVAYLSFIQGGKRQIKNSSLPAIVDELYKIL